MQQAARFAAVLMRPAAPGSQSANGKYIAGASYTTIADRSSSQAGMGQSPLAGVHAAWTVGQVLSSSAAAVGMSCFSRPGTGAFAIARRGCPARAGHSRRSAQPGTDRHKCLASEACRLRRLVRMYPCWLWHWTGFSVTRRSSVLLLSRCHCSCSRTFTQVKRQTFYMQLADGEPSLYRRSASRSRPPWRSDRYLIEGYSRHPRLLRWVLRQLHSVEGSCPLFLHRPADRRILSQRASVQ